MSEARTRICAVALWGLAPACALGTFASEVTTGFALLVAVGLWFTGEPLRPLGGGATWSYAALWILLVPLSGDLHEGLGHVWPLAPLLAIPMLRRGWAGDGAGDGTAAHGHDREPPGIAAGLWAAAAIGTWGFVEGFFGEAHGPFSHHLTLAYALLPTLGVALQRRSALALPIVLGVLGSRSSGAVVALGFTVVLGLWAAADAARGRPARCGRSATAALIGMAVTVLGLGLADPTELHERAVLWTGGLTVGLSAPSGPGAYPAVSAAIYDRLEPGFWFPNHAHDSGTQLLAVLGPAGWLAGLALIAALFDVIGAGAAAGLAGVCIGSLTQDTFGDLEVLRAVLVWAALTAPTPPRSAPPT